MGSAGPPVPVRTARSKEAIVPRITIKEIARRAGVSKGAVSYALNNQPGVSEATRARVLKVAEERVGAEPGRPAVVGGAE